MILQLQKNIRIYQRTINSQTKSSGSLFHRRFHMIQYTMMFPCLYNFVFMCVESINSDEFIELIFQSANNSENSCGCYDVFYLDCNSLCAFSP